jgi:hypothetical protein
MHTKFHLKEKWYIPSALSLSRPTGFVESRFLSLSVWHGVAYLPLERVKRPCSYSVSPRMENPACQLD